MASRNTDTSKKPRPGKKPTSPDTLVKSGKKGTAELSEDELKDVAGGSFSWGVKIN